MLSLLAIQTITVFNQCQDIKGCSVYPGKYEPLPETEALSDEIKSRGKLPLAKPPVNMDEHESCYKLEVVVPGVQREDFLINVYENILTIIVLHKKHDETKEKTFTLHEFDNTYFERHILLPANADTEFISAEYRQGILSMYVPKSNTASHTHSYPIVVY